MAVGLDQHETPMHATTREDMNDLTLYGYEVGNVGYPNKDSILVYRDIP